MFTKIWDSTGYGRGSARNAGLWLPLLPLRGHISALFFSFPAFSPCCKSHDRHPSSPPEGFPVVPKLRAGDMLLLLGMLKISSPVCLGHAFKVKLVMGWRSSSQSGLAGGVGLSGVSQGAGCRHGLATLSQLRNRDPGGGRSSWVRESP